MHDYILKDHGCPTCGSKNFGNIEMNKNQDTTVIQKNSVTTVKNSGTPNLEINYS